MPRRPGPRLLLGALGRRLPRTRGALRVAGLHAGVTIARDRWGIPHVDATTDADAWFGLGFCHGQDRSFQLELIARAGRGTLAALLGPAAVPVDRLSRTLGFARVASAQLALLDADVRATLDAYVRGVNAARAIGPRPHELVLLRSRPVEWAATDVLAFLGLQSLALSGNWDTELARLAILRADGPDALAAVEPTYASWHPAIVPAGASAGAPLDRVAGDVSVLRDLLGGSGGSNAWALAGSRTATGAPILANDPHLGPAVPPPWYLAHLHTPEWELAGASFVGGPAFPTGTNGHAAWGITAGCTDSSDLFWEEVDETASTARGPHAPEPVERWTEPIEVRGDAPTEVVVTLTRRGPLLNPLLEGIDATLSLRATWLEAAAVRGFLDIHRVRDFDGLREAFRAWPGPALNVVYADAAGHVGWQLVGTLPRRRNGNGTLPRPAWEPGWEEEHLPFDDLPWSLDPPTGWVVSANHAPRQDSADAPFLGVDWMDGYRAARIEEALAARGGWDVAACLALQVDTLAVAWREVREVVLAASASDAGAAVGRRLLEAWDGDVTAGSPAASVYELLMAELAVALARDAAPTGWRWAVGDGFGAALPRTSFGARTVSLVVRRLRAGEGRRHIGPALAAATRSLAERFGPDPSDWAWGRVRPLRLRHPLGVRRPLDALLNVGPVPVGGDANTVAQAGVGPLARTANPAAIANHRTVIDLADPDRSRLALAGGQSGNPLSPHYDDLFELWRRGEGVPIAWSAEAVAAATVARLELRPRS